MINDSPKSRIINKTAHGKVFEQEFLKSFQSNIFIQRMKDDTFGYKGVANFCDFICFSSPHLYLFELKSTKQRSLPFSNISKYQIDMLYKYSLHQGVKAGFVFNFRSHNYQTYFLSADLAYEYYYQAHRKSFPLKWVQENGILLPSTLVRTRYRFDLYHLLNPHQ